MITTEYRCLPGVLFYNIFIWKTNKICIYYKQIHYFLLCSQKKIEIGMQIWLFCGNNLPGGQEWEAVIVLVPVYIISHLLFIKAKLYNIGIFYICANHAMSVIFF